MNSKIKKFTLALFFSSLSLSAFADGGICIPTKKGGFNVGIDALYLRANTDNLTYAIVTSDQILPIVSSFGQSSEILTPTYDWGFRAQIGYWFPCTCYDINLAYTHLNTVDQDSVVAPPLANVIIPPLSDNELSDLLFSAANSKVEFNLNVVDLDAGMHASGNCYDARFFAGLRYAQITRDIDTKGDPLSLAVVTDANQQFNSYFKGVGPRFGAQGRYGQCCGWGLDADISMAFLIGQINSHYEGNVVIDDEAFHWPNHGATKNRAIPAFEGKLGVDYTYRIGCKRNASLVFEAGYQASSYLDAVDTPSFNNDYDGQYTSITSITNNITFNGAYLGVKYYA